MKKKVLNLILALTFLAGLSLLLYPSISDWWNSMHATQAVANYAEEVKNLNQEQYDQILSDARAYNQALQQHGSGYVLSAEEKAQYNNQLNVNDTGMMGYIEIPKIDVSLPIYHGTEDSVLQIAAGHLEWSSLPVGGEGTHCVISGHRGLPSAKLFTNLDQLVEGDTFVLRILNEVLTYEVDQILIVEPEDTEALQIVPGEDYCTLVTCTPYGINTHRLLVRGHRIANAEEAHTAFVTADATQIEPVLVAPMLAIPFLILLIIILLIPKKKSQKTKEEDS